jgi:UDP-glucose 4-epimerase
MKTILVTGGYGYIGSHAIKALASAGYTVDSIDFKQSTNKIKRYVRSDRIRDISKMTSIGGNWGEYDAVVHLAGLISVEQSVQYPWLYFKNNILGTKNLLDCITTDHLIFASTAAAFNPASPYATSKIAAEQLVRNQSKNHTIFRFFNVAGNNGEFSQIGESTHLIRIAAETAAGKRTHISINGTDWQTRDGTCIRDYVHVMDLVECILKAIEVPANTDYECIGSGIGYTVNEVIDMMKEISGQDFKVIESPRRKGDTAEVLIPEHKSKYFYGNRTLEEMCLSAYKMELK